MTFSSWLRSWKSALTRTSIGNPPRRCGKRRRPRRLELEVLESRTLMTAGLLDPSFGVGGEVITGEFDSNHSQFSISNVVALPDGGVIAAGFDQRSGPNRFLVARYNAAGEPVAAFGNGGVKVLDGPILWFEGGTQLAVWSNPSDVNDVRIVLAGSTAFQEIPGMPLKFPDSVVVRLKLDGSLDTTFNGTGEQIIDFGDYRPDPNGGFPQGYRDITTAVAVAADGSISLAGFGRESLSHFQPVQIARLTADGNLDPNFGVNGKLILPDPVSGGPDHDVFLALQPDGGMVISRDTDPDVGYYDRSDTDVWRLNPNGSFDTNFGDQ